VGLVEYAFYSFTLRALICADTFSTRKYEFSNLNLRFTVHVFRDVLEML
jgi:hypothetical protein